MLHFNSLAIKKAFISRTGIGGRRKSTGSKVEEVDGNTTSRSPRCELTSLA